MDVCGFFLLRVYNNILVFLQILATSFEHHHHSGGNKIAISPDHTVTIASSGNSNAWSLWTLSESSCLLVFTTPLVAGPFMSLGHSLAIYCELILRSLCLQKHMVLVASQKFMQKGKESVIVWWSSSNHLPWIKNKFLNSFYHRMRMTLLGFYFINLQLETDFWLGSPGESSGWNQIFSEFWLSFFSMYLVNENLCHFDIRLCDFCNNCKIEKTELEDIRNMNHKIYSGKQSNQGP